MYLRQAWSSNGCVGEGCATGLRTVATFSRLSLRPGRLLKKRIAYSPRRQGRRRAGVATAALWGPLVPLPPSEYAAPPPQAETAYAVVQKAAARAGGPGYPVFQAPSLTGPAPAFAAERAPEAKESLKAKMEKKMQDLLWSLIGPSIGLVVGVVSAGKIAEERRRGAGKHESRSTAAKMDAGALQEMISSIGLPPWASMRDIQRPGSSDWANQVIATVWPYLDRATSDAIIAYVDPILEEYCPPFLNSIKFDKLSFGPVPATVEGVKVYDTRADGSVEADIFVVWSGDPDAILSVRTGRDAVRVPLQVTQVQGTACVRLIFSPLLDYFPLFGAVSVSLASRPKLDFDLKVVGNDITLVPGVTQLLRKFLLDILTTYLVWPVRLVVPVAGEALEEGIRMEGGDSSSETFNPGELYIRVAGGSSAGEQAQQTIILGLRKTAMGRDRDAAAQDAAPGTGRSDLEQVVGMASAAHANALHPPNCVVLRLGGAGNGDNGAGPRVSGPRSLLGDPTEEYCVEVTDWRTQTLWAAVYDPGAASMDEGEIDAALSGMPSPLFCTEIPLREIFLKELAGEEGAKEGGENGGKAREEERLERGSISLSLDLTPPEGADRVRTRDRLWGVVQAAGGGAVWAGQQAVSLGKELPSIGRGAASSAASAAQSFISSLPERASQAAQVDIGQVTAGIGNWIESLRGGAEAGGEKPSRDSQESGATASTSSDPAGKSAEQKGGESDRPKASGRRTTSGMKGGTKAERKAARKAKLAAVEAAREALASAEAANAAVDAEQQKFKPSLQLQLRFVPRKPGEFGPPRESAGPSDAARTSTNAEDSRAPAADVVPSPPPELLPLPPALPSPRGQELLTAVSSASLSTPASPLPVTSSALMSTPKPSSNGSPASDLVSRPASNSPAAVAAPSISPSLRSSVHASNGVVHAQKGDEAAEPLSGPDGSSEERWDEHLSSGGGPAGEHDVPVAGGRPATPQDSPQEAKRVLASEGDAGGEVANDGGEAAGQVEDVKTPTEDQHHELSRLKLMQLKKVAVELAESARLCNDDTQLQQISDAIDRIHDLIRRTKSQ